FFFCFLFILLMHSCFFICIFIFFFFKQKTAYEITRRDWSSDVCSSDLRSERHDLDDIGKREDLVDQMRFRIANEFSPLRARPLFRDERTLDVNAYYLLEITPGCAHRPQDIYDLAHW